jgi:hypothetical protein
MMEIIELVDLGEDSTFPLYFRDFRGVSRPSTPPLRGLGLLLPTLHSPDGTVGTKNKRGSR